MGQEGRGSEWEGMGRVEGGCYNLIVMGCCCHEKNYCLETDLIDPYPQKVSLSPSNQLTASKEDSYKLLTSNPQPPLEEGLRQSPILGEQGQQLWEQLADSEEAEEGDLLRATHTNNMPINIENSLRKRAENMPQPRIIFPQERAARSFPTVPKITFGALSTIKEEESSLNDTHRRSICQISVSDHSQRGQIRRMF